jgi:DNA-binding MarR family transcriptional regulator
VLASLAGNGPLAVRDLCERVLAQQPTVTKLLDRLQAQGLLQREDSPTDRRQTLVRLSPAGTERVAPLLTLAKAHEDRVLARLGRGDSQRLKKLLQSLLGD